MAVYLSAGLGTTFTVHRKHRTCSSGRKKKKKHRETISLYVLNDDNVVVTDLSIGPTGDELHHSIGIQVKSMNAHRMILRLKKQDKKKLKHIKTCTLLNGLICMTLARCVGGEY